jgi:excisionase family DNA binding protein
LASDDSKEPQMDTRIPARLYRLDQVCEALSLGRTTVKQLMYDGHLDSIKVGRLRLVPVDSIDRFIAARLESKVAQ